MFCEILSQIQKFLIQDNLQQSDENQEKVDDSKDKDDTEQEKRDSEIKDQEMTDDQQEKPSNSKSLQNDDPKPNLTKDETIDQDTIKQPEAKFENKNISQALSKNDADEEMIDTTKKPSNDIEMIEETKQPSLMQKSSVVDTSQLEKSELEDFEKSELSDSMGFDLNFNRTLSLDALRGMANIPQRAGRSESIKNPILTSFWNRNDSLDMQNKNRPNLDYMNVEDRGFIRHLMIERKYDEVYQYLSEKFPETLKNDKRIAESINLLKLAQIVKKGEFQDAIIFGQENFPQDEEIVIPALDVNGNLVEVTREDYF